MKNPAFDKLSETLIHHSIKIKENDNVLIEARDIPEALVQTLIRTVSAANAKPYVWVKQSRLTRELLLNSSEEQLRLIGKMEQRWMKQMDAYIGIRGGMNINEMSDIPADIMRAYEKHVIKPVHIQERVNNTRWVILRYPTPSFAQQAGMSSDAFEDFFFEVCTMDYSRMEAAMQPLMTVLQKTEHVHIKGPDTDLQFSIKDIPVVGCAGTHNIPDGEIFTAPIRDSVNGHISFNTATIYHGISFSDIYLKFENGKIVDARADKTEALNKILDTDEGSRFIGEFALGFNPLIKKPMLDILFDEKMTGSFHLTPGQAYEEADNGNRSNIHWDMVMQQRPEAGGGEIYFDGELIRKDGLFRPGALSGLNPDAFH